MEIIRDIDTFKSSGHRLISGDIHHTLNPQVGLAHLVNTANT